MYKNLNKLMKWINLIYEIFNKLEKLKLIYNI